MLIIEKYERVINYLYPIAQTISNQHKIAKQLFLQVLFDQVQILIQGGKLNQISKLYQVDAGLASIRFWLRFFSNPKVKQITEHQKLTTEILLSEVGQILGSWIKKLNSTKKG
jgi:hypothetical protein